MIMISWNHLVWDLPVSAVSLTNNVWSNPRSFHSFELLGLAPRHQWCHNKWVFVTHDFFWAISGRLFACVPSISPQTFTIKLNEKYLQDTSLGSGLIGTMRHKDKVHANDNGMLLHVSSIHSAELHQQEHSNLATNLVQAFFEQKKKKKKKTEVQTTGAKHDSDAHSIIAQSKQHQPRQPFGVGLQIWKFRLSVNVWIGGLTLVQIKVCKASGMHDPLGNKRLKVFWSSKQPTCSHQRSRCLILHSVPHIQTDWSQSPRDCGGLDCGAVLIDLNRSKVPSNTLNWRKFRNSETTPTY